MLLTIRISIVVGLIILAAPLFSEELVLVTPSADYRATEEAVNRVVDPQLDPTEMVNAHDQVRDAVNAGTQPGPLGGVSGAGFQPVPNPLMGGVSWDAVTIAPSAQSWSDNCNFSHPGGHPYGENIYAATSSAAPPIIWAEADAVVTSWAGESADYDYAANAAIPPGTAVVGHYTQVAWADSRTIGCGATQCTVNSPFGGGFPNWVIVVCRYDAPGNWVGIRPYCTTLYPNDCALPVELLIFGVE